MVFCASKKASFPLKPPTKDEYVVCGTDSLILDSDFNLIQSFTRDFVYVTLNASLPITAARRAALYFWCYFPLTSHENIERFNIVLICHNQICFGWLGEVAKERSIWLQDIPISFDLACFYCTYEIVSKRNFLASVLVDKNKFT